MPPIATGVAKRVVYKKEGTWGVAPGTGAAQYLRRVRSTLELAKATYQSGEIRADYQVADMRHGVRSVQGQISGELSASTWKDFFAAVCRKSFVAVAASTGQSITISGTGPTYTVARGAGSWLTDGVKAGDVTRLTVGTFNAANLNKNLLVLSETAANLTVQPLNGVALVAEGPITASTLAVTGKKTFMPITAQTDDSFAIEHFYSDISQSELFLGCKVQRMGIQLPPTGMATIDLDFMGKDVTPAAAAYYVAPTAETTSKLLAAVNGALLVQGASVGLLTGLSFNASASMSAEPVVGSNTYADITEGRMEVSGQFTVLFQDATFRDYFLNETEVALVAALSDSPAAAAEFIGFSLPRIKVGGASRDDGEKGLVLTCPFTALLATAGGAGTSSENSTLVIQDSLA